MLTSLQGSDHCPVYAILKPRVTLDGKNIDIRDLLNPPDVFKDGERLRDCSTKDLVPFSGKLLPEFDRRRSIKDMFKNQASSLGPKAMSSTQVPLASFSSTLPKSPSNINTQPKSSTVKIGNSRSPQKDSSPPSKRLKLTAPRKDGPQLSSSQSTLKSFFKPKQANATDPASSARSPPQTDPASVIDSQIQVRLQTTDDLHEILPPEADAEDEPPAELSDAVQAHDNPGTTAESSIAESEKFIDPFVSRAEWGKLFTKRDPPRCESHSEPCITLETKKKGPNCGRWFWICPR
jgi:AP endonuclease-2